jgi:hypothetical protein
MEQIKHYRVIGVFKTTGDDFSMEVEALSEENARVKAELRDVVVTSVEQLIKEPTLSPSQYATLQSKVQVSSKELSQKPFKMSPLSPSDTVEVCNTVNHRLAFVLEIFGWIILVLAVLATIGAWAAPRHRSPILEDLVQYHDVGSISTGLAYLMGYNILGFLALFFGLTIIFVSKFANGKTLTVLASLTIAFNIIGQFRQSSPSFSNGQVPEISATDQSSGQCLPRVPWLLL